jgi:hypothetical protein
MADVRAGRLWTCKNAANLVENLRCISLLSGPNRTSIVSVFIRADSVRVRDYEAISRCPRAMQWDCSATALRRTEFLFTDLPPHLPTRGAGSQKKGAHSQDGQRANGLDSPLLPI